MLFDKAYKENVANMSATDMAVLMYYTATLRSGYSLKYEEEEVTDEEPHEEHDDQDRDILSKDMTEVQAPIQKAMEIAPLDALYPMKRVLSDGEKPQTHHMMSVMHENAHKEDVKKIAPLDALYPTMRVLSDGKK
jgi:uncharacterized protein (DUF4213/DUF364 family)